MMQQYARIKDSHRDAILFYRLGDFYEMFRGDAEEASALLGLTLTSRQGVPMCGVPHHAARSYISRLLAAGKKIAICEQTSLPTGGRGLAQRDVVEVVTPGTATDEDFIEARESNYIVSVASDASNVFTAYLELSTGEFRLGRASLAEGRQFLRQELARLRPREVLVQQSLLENGDISDTLTERSKLLINRYPDWQYDSRASAQRAMSLLNLANLKAFGLAEDAPDLLPVGVLIEYVEETARSVLEHIRSVELDDSSAHVGLDESTMRNLEITSNLRDGGVEFTLFGVLDYTRTAMGTRTLRKWLLSPLKSPEAIMGRQDQVSELFADQRLLGTIREHLSRVLDIQRLAGRLAMERAHAKDLVAIKESVRYSQAVWELLENHGCALEFVSVGAQTRSAVGSVAELVSRALLDEPATLINEGGMIRHGYDTALDEFRSLRDNSRHVLESYVAEERDSTGISSLKVRYNRVIGHFLEVTKANSNKVPERFIRRQSLANSERFTTERLADIESRLNDAAERIVETERDLFLDLRATVRAQIVPLMELAIRLAELDVLQSLAQAATVRNYTAPAVTTEASLRIVGGRHPVVEANQTPGSFIPNGIRLRPDGDFFALITGPNMAGKSTYLRQVALIVLMAQVGSFVPAEEAEIGVVDRIFCRVGASDNLARGESTFLVEMNEAAFILRNATPASLIIMDEIGRGTSTNDGQAIAQAVSEHIVGSVGARTLFATHFHELTAMNLDGMVNLSLQVAEEGESIVFLKRIVPRPSNNSYGIHVARLAGVPDRVVSRASEILRHLVTVKEPPPERFAVADHTSQQDSSQQGLFAAEELVIDEICSVALDEIRPIDALNHLSRWQQELQQGRHPQDG